MRITDFDIELVSPAEEDDLVVEVSCSRGVLFRMFRDSREKNLYIIKFIGASQMPMPLELVMELIGMAQTKWENSGLS